MGTDEYLAIVSKAYCKYAAHGTPPVKEKAALINGAIRHNINKSCSTKVRTPYITCPDTYTISNKNYLIVGTASSANIFSGYYVIEVGTNMTPDFAIMDAYFNANPSNFINNGVVSGAISMTSPSAFFIVLKVPSNLTISIFDATLLDITSTFIRVIQGIDSYYIKYTTIAPTTVGLTITL